MLEKHSLEGMEKENREDGADATSVKKTRKSLGRRVSFARTKQVRHFDVDENNDAKGLNAVANVTEESVGNVTGSSAGLAMTADGKNLFVEPNDLFEQEKDGLSFHIPNVTSRRISTAFNFQFENRRRSSTSVADANFDDDGLALTNPDSSHGAGVSLKAALGILKGHVGGEVSAKSSSQRAKAESDAMDLADSDTGRIEELTGRYSDVPQVPEISHDVPSSPHTMKSQSTLAEQVASPQSVRRLIEYEDMGNNSISTIAAPDNFMDDESDAFEERAFDLNTTMTVDMDMEMTASVGQIIEADTLTLEESCVPARDAHSSESLAGDLFGEAPAAVEQEEKVSSWEKFFDLCNVAPLAVNDAYDGSVFWEFPKCSSQVAVTENSALCETMTDHLVSQCAELEGKVNLGLKNEQYPVTDAVLISEYELGSAEEKSNIRGLVGATVVGCAALSQLSLAKYQLGLTRQTNQFVDNMLSEIEADCVANAKWNELASRLHLEFKDGAKEWQQRALELQASVALMEEDQRAATLELAQSRESLRSEIAQLTLELNSLEALGKELQLKISSLTESKLSMIEKINSDEKELVHYDTEGGTHAELKDLKDRSQLYSSLLNYLFVEHSKQLLEWRYNGVHSLFLSSADSSGSKAPRVKQWNIVIQPKQYKRSFAVSNLQTLQQLFLVHLPSEEAGPRGSRLRMMLYKFPLFLSSYERLVSDLVSVQAAERVISAVGVYRDTGSLFDLRFDFFFYDKSASFAAVVSFADWRYPIDLEGHPLSVKLTNTLGTINFAHLESDFQAKISGLRSLPEMISCLKELVYSH